MLLNFSKFRLLQILLIIFVVFPCSTEKNNAIENNSAFRKYIAKFQLLDLPYKFRPNEFDASNLKQLDESDSLFCKNLPAYYGGILKDTSNYFYIITILPSDDFVPQLSVFDKKGLLLDSQTIIARGCSGGPCINYCSTTSIINKDLSLFSIDSSFVTACDSLDKEIKGTDTLFCEFFKGSINKIGKIILENTESTKTKLIGK